MRLEETTWQELQGAASRGVPVILPSGALTQYGPHLPVGSNSIIAHRLALKTAEKVEAVVAPPLWYGYAYPGSKRAGTITIYPDTLATYTEEVLESLCSSGFRTFLLFYGQLPNLTSLNHAAQRLIAKVPDSRIAVVAWWQLAKDALKKEFADETGHHAESSETSLMLALAGELVRTDLIRDDSAQLSIGYDLYPRPAATMSASGVIGRPTLATKEKGEVVVREVVEKLADLLSHELLFESQWQVLNTNKEKGG